MIRIRTRWVLLGVLAFVVSLVSVDRYAEGEFWLVALPGYVTGAGTLALAVVAYLTMLSEAQDRRELRAVAERERERADRVEARERLRREYRERRAQAEGVQVPPVQFNYSTGAGAYLQCTWQVKVNNDSNDAISNLRLYFALDPAEARVPDQQPSGLQLPDRLVAHDSTLVMPAYLVYPGYAQQPIAGRAWLTFEDADGRRWVRDPRHMLAEVSGEYLDALGAAEANGMIGAPDTPFVSEEESVAHQRP